MTSSMRFCWRIARSPKNFEVYNVATGDYITVTEIAELAIQVAGLPKIKCVWNTPAAIAAGRATFPSFA